MDSDGWLTGEDTWRNDESLRFRYAQWESSTDGKFCRFKGARQGFTPLRFGTCLKSSSAGITGAEST